jgi:S-adenosylmethionine:tRNA ribosyltransferase-isomerase
MYSLTGNPQSMKTKDLFYSLPEEFIAQYPAEERDESRLMVLKRKTSSWEHKRFDGLINYLRSGDLLVLNNTKVIPARLIGHKVNAHNKIEVLLLKEIAPGSWEALVRPSKKVPINTRIVFGSGDLKGIVTGICGPGRRVIEFFADGPLKAKLKQYGMVPLPLYIKRNYPRSQELDELRYQTVYAQVEGAIAAPTAGLHFTERLLERIKESKVQILYLTLHIGAGTFRPIKSEALEEHGMESEYYSIEAETVDIINQAEEKGKRVIAVGTSVAKALETIFGSPYQQRPLEGWTDLFIYPGYCFNSVDALVTNFHLPGSTPLALVFAFAGQELILKAYQAAIEERYRFYSYGDAMLII